MAVRRSVGRRGLAGEILDRCVAAWGAAAHPFRDRRLVLCLHSIAGEPDDAEDRGHVSGRQRIRIGRLRQWLEWLSRRATFMTLGDLLRDRGTGLRVAVTFDDGYADVLSRGLPLLERYGIHPTWFVSPWFVEHGDRLPWWDLLDYVRRHVREEVEYSFREESFRYDLRVPADRDRFEAEQARRFLHEGADRRGRRYRVLVDGLPGSVDLPRNGFATEDELRDAVRSDRIRLGGHTLTHQNLAACSGDVLEREVVEGKRVVESWTGEEVEHFAYPFGGDAYWNAEAKQAVGEAGFSAAFVLDPDYVASPLDRLALPRLSVEDGWSFAEFRARVLGSEVYRELRDVRDALRIDGSAG